MLPISSSAIIRVHLTEPWMKARMFMVFCEAFPAKVSMMKEIQKKIMYGIHIRIYMQIPRIPFQ